MLLTIPCSFDHHVFHGVSQGLPICFPYVFPMFSLCFPYVFPMFSLYVFPICFPYVFVHRFPPFPTASHSFHGSHHPGLAPQQRGAAAFDAGQMPGLGESVAGQLGRPGSRTPEPWVVVRLMGNYRHSGY